MTARQFWIGVVLIVAAILFHAAFPRYEYRTRSERTWVRYDRWTGSATIQPYYAR